MSAYKVEYSTLAITTDGVGNVNQGNGIAYFEGAISSIDDRLTKVLAEDKLYPLISKITKIDGWMLT